MLRRLLSLGIELRFWVATCVTALSAFAARTLGLTTPPEVLGVTFLATLALYNLDGSLDAPARGQSARRRRAHVALSALSTALSLPLALRLNPSALVLLAGGFVACGSYALPTGSPGRTLKRIPLFKAPFVGASVGIATVLLPVLSSKGGSASWIEVSWLTTTIAIACTHNAILFDVADLEEDGHEGVVTVPRALGIRRARSLGAVLVGLGLVATGLAPKTIPTAAQLAFVPLWGALLIGSMTVEPQTRKATVALAIDGALIFPWAMMTLAP